MQNYLNVYTPTTLASMAADLSHYLVEEFDGGDVISAEAWDAVQADAKRIIATLITLVGDEAYRMLVDAGADKTYIL